jgi:hypothetical protein
MIWDVERLKQNLDILVTELVNEHGNRVETVLTATFLLANGRRCCCSAHCSSIVVDCLLMMIDDNILRNNNAFLIAKNSKLWKLENTGRNTGRLKMKQNTVL